MELPIFDREFGGKRPAWEELTKEQQEKWINDMATYAAMIEIMDEGVGKIMDAVKAKGIYENTVFIFLSDNGATEEGGYIGQLMSDLSNTPYRSYKQWVYQGGTSTPFILTYGSGKTADERKDMPSACTPHRHIAYLYGHRQDRISGTFCPRQSGGRNLIPASEGKPLEKRTLYFEHQSSCAIIDGSWKLVRASRNTPWELINLKPIRLRPAISPTNIRKR